MIGEFQLLPNSVFEDFVNKKLLDDNFFILTYETNIFLLIQILQ